MTLTERLAADEAKRRADAAAKYRDLILADDPAGLADLKRVMDVLGLTPADAQADADALAKYRRAVELLKAPDTAAEDLASAWRTTRAEIGTAVNQLLAAAPDNVLPDIYRAIWDRVVPAVEGTSVLAGLDLFGKLNDRINTFETAAERRLEAVVAAEHAMAEIAAAHPRLGLAPSL